MKNPEKFFETVKSVSKIKVPVMLSGRDVYQILEDEIFYYKNHNPAKETFERGFLAGLRAAQQHVVELTKIEKKIIKENRGI